jgi:hypothetical protein
MSLGLPFTCPETASVGGVSLASLIDAVARGDSVALATFRAQTGQLARELDRFVAGLRHIVSRDYAAAVQDFTTVGAPSWGVAASILRALAAAASGDLRGGLALANQTRDDLREALERGEIDERYLADLALIRAALQCLAEIERSQPVPAARPAIPAPFFYVVSYPRSGNSLLRTFLSFAFRAPTYSVYPGDGRYFSRYFHDTSQPHAVFVKDHSWRDEYSDENVLAVVRDGRDVSLSYARYLYADGYHTYVGPHDLSAFLTFVTERGIGFWADHVRTVLAARERGGRIRLVRYEDIFRNYAGLSALARQIANGAPVPRDDQAAFVSHLAESKRMFVGAGWKPNVTLPEDSYLPRDWSVGGGTIDWRRAFDLPARRRFHELGGTEMLLKLGYETDPVWWRSG